jgi:hypothetical protein
MAPWTVRDDALDRMSRAVGGAGPMQVRAAIVGTASGSDKQSGDN